MRRWLLLPFLALLALPALGSGGFVINNFSAKIELRPDGVMDVTETINVQFTEPRHGIYRFIPIHYRTRREIDRDLLISVESVTDENGIPYAKQISTGQSRNVNIRIGDANIVLPRGSERTYVIHYLAEGALNWFDKSSDWQPYCELYWNVTGNEWESVINNADFTITYPPVPDGKGLRMRVFTGVIGAADSDALAEQGTLYAGRNTDCSLKLTTSSASGARATELKPAEGITVALDLPANLVARPTAWQIFRIYALPNLGFGIPIFALIGMLILWFTFGRDPSSGPMVVQYDPPDDLSGPEAGTLIDERVDQRDIAAGIISLAVKGHLQIQPKEEGLIFKHKSADLIVTAKNSSEGLTFFERHLLMLIEKGGSTVTPLELQEYVAPQLSTLKGLLYKSLVERGYYLTSPDSARLFWWLVCAAAVVVVGIVLAVISPTHNLLPPIVGVVTGLVVITIFDRLMPRRTPAGAKAYSQVLGFQEFIRRARRKEFEWVSKNQPTMALFEKYLPHAVAFGYPKMWTDAFEGFLTEPPSWYLSTGPFYWNTFGSDLNVFSGTFASTAGSMPRQQSGSGWSSGGSGFSGGSSGGGGGGGGGGSW